MSLHDCSRTLFSFFRPLFSSLFVLGVLLGTGASCASASERFIPPASPLGGTRTLLGPGDIVEVTIFGEPELSGVHQVTGTGAIRLPLVGDIHVAGVPVDEVSAKVEAAYNEKFLRQAQVTVLVKEFQSGRIYVLGQIAKPGPYPYYEHMTVIGAIALAGGTNREADPDSTIVTRGEAGQQQRFTVAVGRIGKGLSPDIELIPGDIVFIPQTLF